MVSFIWITTQFEGLHKYPKAPEDVSFLRNEHRHLFKVKVWIEVTHNDREIEFFQFKEFVEKLIDYENLNFLSCEMISDKIGEGIVQQYGIERRLRIEISEDGENGSYKEY